VSSVFNSASQDYEVIYDPVFSNGKTYSELKSSYEIIDEIILPDKYPHLEFIVENGQRTFETVTIERPYLLFFKTSFRRREFEFFRIDTNAYFFRETHRGDLITEGPLNVKENEIIGADTSVIYNPISFDEVHWVRIKCVLVKHGDWVELDSLGRTCSGKYHQGKKFGEWSVITKRDTINKDYVDGIFKAYFSPRINLVNDNIHWLIDQDLFLCEGAIWVKNESNSSYKVKWILYNSNYLGSSGLNRLSKTKLLFV
jgi:hypothetical protein